MHPEAPEVAEKLPRNRFARNPIIYYTLEVSRCCTRIFVEFGVFHPKLGPRRVCGHPGAPRTDEKGATNVPELKNAPEAALKTF